MHVRFLICVDFDDHRIDCFSDISTSLFGEKLKEQVEERLLFYEQGAPPRKNSEAMKVIPCAITLTAVSKTLKDTGRPSREDPSETIPLEILWGVN